MENRQSKDLETITLGGGCFWCLDAVYQRVHGVVRVECGYTNGSFGHPTYAQVCTGQTGHNEVVKVTFDPQIISLHQLLKVFFTIHDPTTPNRQGNDVGTQYRSGIYVNSPAQQAEVERFIEQLKQEQVFDAALTTEIAWVNHYSRAEDEHQNYFANHPYQGYCAAIIAPKVRKFRANFQDLWLP